MAIFKHRWLELGDLIGQANENSEAILERIEGRAGESDLALQREIVCALAFLTEAVLLFAQIYLETQEVV